MVLLLCQIAQQTSTTGQQNNPLWALAINKARLTASNFGYVLAAVRRKRYICYAYKITIIYINHLAAIGITCTCLVRPGNLHIKLTQYYVIIMTVFNCLILYAHVLKVVIKQRPEYIATSLRKS